MRGIYLLLVIGLSFGFQVIFCQDDFAIGILYDIRDGQNYPTIKIGEQTWMAKNLAFKPEDEKIWAFNGDIRYVEDYGYLYSWEISQNVCPIGWHLPGKSEFETLLKKYNGDGKYAYNDLSLTGKSGFCLLESGFRFNMNYIPFNAGSAFWTSTEINKRKAWALRSGGQEKIAILTDFLNKNSGLSIRCLKNEQE